MTTDVPLRVQAGAEKAGFGPLTAKFLHPNGRVYAIVYGGWAFMLIVYPVIMLAVMIGGPSAGARWAVALPAVAVLAALGVLLARQAIGSVNRRAFYLYPQGYIATAASGRVVRVVNWRDVSRIEGAGPGLTMQVRAGLFGKVRNVCLIRHHRGKGRPIRFTEIADRATVAPLAYRLHAQAIHQES
ncbi:hypothetical protein JOF56_002567 [Kibdelosporangium banguiense]|uniref:PH domain-containing protein n=1 Tax=Kibdelosporangium banguiense TaxID=1365924 RepID=A0ABS4TCN7_9PSEU|nr:hypothetical protein [Kibdelosporangium banguiense]MBP2322182.1 hypothetical protein [Kibdelosporangium banguiense]